MIFAHLIQSASSLPTDASALESSISALERDIKALDSSSVPWEHSLPWFTAIVALGVVMELWVIRHEWRDDMETWALTYFGVLRSPSRPSTGKFLIEVASVLLITVGIVGELWIGIKITSINGDLRGKNAELRTASDHLTALLHLEAQEAQKEAGEANERAEEIRASVAPRRLTDNERKSIRLALKRFARQKVAAWHNTFDVEASVFAVDLMNGLRSTDWDTSQKLSVGGNISAVVGAPAIPETGIWVSVDSGDARSRAAAEAAVRCFSSLGYDARISPKSFPASMGLVAIEVKPRPVGPQGEAKLRAEAAKKKQQASNQITAP